MPDLPPRTPAEQQKAERDARAARRHGVVGDADQHRRSPSSTRESDEPAAREDDGVPGAHSSESQAINSSLLTDDESDSGSSDDTIVGSLETPVPPEQQLGLEQDTDMATKKIEYPDFWPHMPTEWINLVESIFTEHKIDDETARYNAMLCHIKHEHLQELSDILKNPPAQGKYGDLKEKIKSRFAHSEDKLLRDLFNKMELGGQKPSQLLRQMRNKAGTAVNEKALIVKWLSLLPRELQVSLTVLQEKSTSTELEETADKLHDLHSGSGVHSMSASTVNACSAVHQPADVAATSRQSAYSAPPAESPMMSLLQQILQTNQQLLAQSRGRCTDRQDPNLSGGNRPRSRSRSSNRYGNMCYYHYKFGPAALKCKEPCQFQQTPQFTQQQQQYTPRLPPPQFQQQQQHQFPQQQQQWQARLPGSGPPAPGQTGSQNPN